MASCGLTPRSHRGRATLAPAGSKSVKSPCACFGGHQRSRTFMHARGSTPFTLRWFAEPPSLSMAHNLTGHDHLTIFNVLLAWRQRSAHACTQTLSLRERCQDPYHRHRCGRRRHRRQNLQRQLTALCGQLSAHYSMARMPTSAPEPCSRAAGEPVLQDAGHGRQLAFGDLLVMLVRK